MTTYHVSTKKYNIGNIVKSNNYYEVSLSRNNEWVENILEKHRPQNYPNRKQCVFSFENIDEFGYYSDYLTGDLNYYEVEILDSPIKCPMVLCDFIKTANNKDYDKLAVEYWNKTKNWNFLELLCGSFKIVGLITKPAIIQKLAGRKKYKDDEQIASQFINENQTK